MQQIWCRNRRSVRKRPRSKSERFNLSYFSYFLGISASYLSGDETKCYCSSFQLNSFYVSPRIWLLDMEEDFAELISANGESWCVNYLTLLLECFFRRGLISLTTTYHQLDMKWWLSRWYSTVLHMRQQYAPRIGG